MHLLLFSSHTPYAVCVVYSYYLPYACSLVHAVARAFYIKYRTCTYIRSYSERFMCPQQYWLLSLLIIFYRYSRLLRSFKFLQPQFHHAHTSSHFNFPSCPPQLTVIIYPLPPPSHFILLRSVPFEISWLPSSLHLFRI